MTEISRKIIAFIVICQIYDNSQYHVESLRIMIQIHEYDKNEHNMDNVKIFVKNKKTEKI